MAVIDPPTIAGGAGSMPNRVKVRFSTAEIVDGLAMANWMDRSLGPRGAARDMRLDLEKDELTWLFSEDQHRLLFQLTWGYRLG